MVWGLAWMLVQVWLLRSRNGKKLAMSSAEKEEEELSGVTGDRSHSFMYKW